MTIWIQELDEDEGQQAGDCDAWGYLLAVSKLLISMLSVSKDVVVVTAHLSWPRTCWVPAPVPPSLGIKKPSKQTNELLE